MSEDHANAPRRVAFLARVGNLVTEYNRLEYFAHQIVLQLAGGTEQVWVLTAELSAVDLIKALSALAVDYVSGDVGERLKRFADGFDRMRVYRNYYIHGLWEISAVGDTAYGILMSTTTRTGRLASDIHTPTEEEIIWAVTQCHLFQEFGRQLSISLAEAAGRDLETWQPASLPEMPPLPKALARNRVAHRFFSNPLGSSRD